jgi:hypothetical protein
MAALFALHWTMVKLSPRRELIEQRLEEQEREWQRIQKELFARYVTSTNSRTSSSRNSSP